MFRQDEKLTNGVRILKFHHFSVYGKLCCQFDYVVSFDSFSSTKKGENYHSPYHSSHSFHVCLISLYFHYSTCLLYLSPPSNTGPLTDVNYYFPPATIKIPGFPLLISWFFLEAGDPEGARRATGGSPAGAIASMFIF